MEKPDGSESKKAAGRRPGQKDSGVRQILKPCGETISLQRLLSDAREMNEELPYAAEPGFFCNLDVLFSKLIHNGTDYLGSIKGYASLIQDDNGEDNNSRRWAYKIAAKAGQMERFLELLSTFGMNAAAGPTPVSWREIADGVLRHFSRLNKRGLYLAVTNNTAGPIRQHGGLLRRVLIHLVSNAYESMPGDGKITMVISDSVDGRLSGRKKKTTVEISDTGCGIDEKNAAMIWKPFFTTKSGHAGLGLPFVATAARIMDMEVELHSKTGRGTTVAVVLTEQGG